MVTPPHECKPENVQRELIRKAKKTEPVQLFPVDLAHGQHYHRQHAVNSSRVINIEDLRRLAQRRLPKSVFDYLDGGAEDELTLAENCRAFHDVLFRPRSAVENSRAQP